MVFANGRQVMQMAYAIIIKKLFCQVLCNEVIRDNPSFIRVKGKKIEELS